MSFCGADFSIGKKSRAFMIFNKKSKEYERAYCRAYHDDFMFSSPEEARSANFSGLFKDEDTYEIHEVEVTVKRKRKR